MLDKRVKPSFIVRNLDQYVVGQDEAKKILAVAVYSHYRKVAKMQDDGVEIAKSNVLLIGPSGSGKTLMCETLSRVLGVPFVTANATSLAPTSWPPMASPPERNTSLGATRGPLSAYG